MALFGFIGVGNMGGAIAAAVSKTVDSREIIVSALHRERAEQFAQQHGMRAGDNQDVANEAHFVVLGVKPQFMQDVLTQIRPVMQNRRDVVLVTMAAGLSMQQIADMAGGDFSVIRIMPNTPARVGQGVILYDYNDRVIQEDLDRFLEAMRPAGRVDHLPEKLIDAGSAVAGCGPAYACLFMEALADGGVACGLPRQKALEYAAQMLLGSARLVLESGDHPGKLKDQVCSPGGSTIQGVRALEKGGFRSAVMEAVIAAWEKNRDLGK